MTKIVDIRQIEVTMPSFLDPLGSKENMRVKIVNELLDRGYVITNEHCVFDGEKHPRFYWTMVEYDDSIEKADREAEITARLYMIKRSLEDGR